MSKGPASSIEPFSEQCLHPRAHSAVNKGGSEEASCSLTGKSLIMNALQSCSLKEDTQELRSTLCLSGSQAQLLPFLTEASVRTESTLPSV